MKYINATIPRLLFPILALFIPLLSQAKSLNNQIILYTPYTSRSITPGKTLSYNIDVINQTGDIQNIHFYVRGIPNKWNPTLTAGANTIQEISVEPQSLNKKHSQKIQLNLKVPLKIRKGWYHLRVVAHANNGSTFTLPLKIHVTKKGIFKTELQVDQANMEGYASSNFNYNMNLINQTGKQQNYALTADAPPGWDIRFRVSGNYVTSVALASNKSKKIYIKVKPPQQVKAGKYKIHIRATSGTTSDTTNLVSVIKGQYKMELSTPSGRLSTDITAGNTKDVKLLLKNTGTVPLRDVKLNSSTPDGWDVTFSNQKITRLNAGESTYIHAKVKASSKAIAGDYRLKITAQTPKASSKASFRITVDKSVGWGAIGIAIIIIVIAGIFLLIRKYGRR